MLGSLGMTNPVQGDCRYGVIPPGGELGDLGGVIWYFALVFVPIAAVSRCLFLDADTHRFTAGSLGAIFQSETTASGCFRRLMWAQVFGGSSGSASHGGLGS